jgi:hypothetical protein
MPAASYATRTIVGWLVVLTSSVGLAAADAELDALNRATGLLARRGHAISAVVMLEDWPADAPSADAFAMKGRIYVRSRSGILQAAVRSTRFDVVLASLLLHEQSHLRGADEMTALQLELKWLISERAPEALIQEIRKAIARERDRTR